MIRRTRRKERRRSKQRWSSRKTTTTRTGTRRNPQVYIWNEKKKGNAAIFLILKMQMNSKLVLFFGMKFQTCKCNKVLSLISKKGAADKIIWVSIRRMTEVDECGLHCVLKCPSHFKDAGYITMNEKHSVPRIGL